MYLITVGFVVCTIAVTLFIKGRGAALGMAWALVFLCPAWMEREFGAFKLTPRLIALTFAIGGLFVFSDSWKLNRRLVLLDFLVVGIALVEMIGMYHSRELTVTMAAQGVAFWICPYLLGRLVTSSNHHESDVISMVMIVICILTCWGLVEAITHINPVNMALGRADFGGSFRWGLRRAEGPLQHPIHFGNMMLMLFPWSLEAARRSFKGDGPIWWRMAPAISFAGVFSAISRGPLLGVFIAVGCVAFLKFPRCRPVLVAGCLFVVAAIMINASGTVDALEQSTGEEQEWGAFVIMIDGTEYEYTGTNHRLLQFLVFKPALYDAGLFGFGTWGLKPKHIAYIEPVLRQKFWSIDNHYILITLRSGYLGLGMFFALGGTALCYALRLGLYGKRDSLLASAMCGAIAASLLILWSVWFSPDFSFTWLASIGVVAGWWARNQSAEQTPRLGTT